MVLPRVSLVIDDTGPRKIRRRCAVLEMLGLGHLLGFIRGAVLEVLGLVVRTHHHEDVSVLVVLREEALTIKIIIKSKREMKNKVNLNLGESGIGLIQEFLVPVGWTLN